MPYVRKTTRKPNRVRRKRVYRKRKTISSFNKAPMPNKFASKLRYVELSVISPGVAGIAGVRVMSANGLYDPSITGVGHQPRGFDQLMTMYDHFVVVGSRITVTFSTIYATAYPAMICGINLKDSATVYTDPNDYQEGRNLVTRTIKGTSTSSETSICTISKSFSCKKFLGRSHPLSDPQLKGDVGNNPAEQAYYHVWSAPLDGSTDTGNIRVNIRIDYLVIFIEPRQPSQS